MARNNKKTQSNKDKKNRKNNQKNKKEEKKKERVKKQPSAAEVLKKQNQLEKTLKLTVPLNINGKIEEGSLVRVIDNKTGVTGIYEVKNIVLNLKKENIASFMSLDLEEVVKDEPKRHSGTRTSGA